ncbi:Kelch-like protein 5 [Chionoecetes opilio]|uniref:Kelch-like protein 5 n=1 Tax=Chionoecetes opilio TaxID=41210 RepID=A0A8J4XM33_CHIOP|nr:Kelch-like protein 5 [Chionoecetes opilio]
MEHFQEVMHHQEFVQLPPEEAAHLLASEDLNVPSEELIFQEGTGEADDSVLREGWTPAAASRVDRSHTRGGVPGEELRVLFTSQFTHFHSHYTVGVEARTLQQKVFNSLRDVPAPGAVGFRGLTEAMQVNRECRVPKYGIAEGPCGVRKEQDSSKFAAEAWEIVEVLDEVSRVRPPGEHGQDRVLHRSNLHPWGGLKDGVVGVEREELEGRESEEKVEVPDMEEVLKRFGIRGTGTSREDEVNSSTEQEGLSRAGDLPGEGQQSSSDGSEESKDPSSVKDRMVETT